MPTPQDMGANWKDGFHCSHPTPPSQGRDSNTVAPGGGGKGQSLELFCYLFICGVRMTSQPSRHPTLLITILDPIASVRVKIRKLWADALNPVVSLEGTCSKARWAGTGPSPGTISLTSGQEITSILPFSTAANSTCAEGVLTQVRNVALESMC